MPASNHIFRTTLLIGCLSTRLAADVLTLDNGSSTLSGDILSIEPQGVIQLQSTLSAKPLRVKVDKLDKAVFSKPTENIPSSAIRITLINDDILPVSNLLGMKDGTVTVDSPLVGTIPIPAAAIHSIQFGISPDTVLYPQKGKPIEWLDEPEELRSWKINNDSLAVDGSGVVANTFELPKDFVLSFKLTWSKKSSPNCRIFFAGPKQPERSNQDGYRMNFSASGLQLERQTSNQPQGNVLAQLRRLPASFEKNEMEVSIHVNRSKRQLELFINGESEGVYADPIEQAPGGSTISFTCYGSNGATQQISNFRILALNDVYTRHLAEGRGDASQDVMITRDEDRWPGELAAIHTSPDGNLLTFKSKILNEPIEIPQSEIATLMFAKRTPEVSNPFGKVNYKLTLQSSGSLLIHSCNMQDQSITAEHPLLGALNISKSFVETITKADKPGS